MRPVELNATERAAFVRVLERPEPTTALVHGQGAHRALSFYAEGTRLEARVAVPEERPGEPREDLKLTAGELRQWLGGVPDGAVVRLNVNGAVGDCEGHVLGEHPLDSNQRVVVLTSGGVA